MRRHLGWLCILPALAALAPANPVAAAAAVSFTSAMQAASQTRQVPLALIEATAYVNTRWEWIGTPANDGGVGPMNVLPSQIDHASVLSGHTRSQIAGDLSANLDAGAALLAYYHMGGTDLASWQPAAAATQGSFVASEIFDAMRAGASRTTSTGETITLDPQPLASTSPSGASGASVPTGAASAAATATDYPPATWAQADLSNFSWANRPHDYPVDMIIIHDIEGSYGSAIQEFQTPNYGASANYVVGYQGQITQMVREQNIAWHAGNWDYNTRAIGIEHEGFAAYNLYTKTEYDASAALAASICSRWGVPMDRTHVIGHFEVPDPNNPALYGGSDHHTDPGPYWNWTYYMAQAVADTKLLPSPPHMMPDPVAVNGLTSATVSWQPARTCRAADRPITGYAVVGQPGNLTMSLPATATTATFNNLQPGTSYTFTVTATNLDGQDSLTSNAVVPGRCNNVQLTATPGSPQLSGTTVQLASTSASCASPLYAFGMLGPEPSSTWTLVQPYSTSATFNWKTTGQPAGTYNVEVLARDATSPGTNTSTMGTYDDAKDITYTVSTAACTAVTASAAPPSPSLIGTPITVTGIATGCPSPQYQFWLLAPGSTAWQIAQAYSPSATFSWNTSTTAAGTYQLSVWVRDSSSSGTNSTALGTLDAFAGLPYTLAPKACTAVAAPATPTAAMYGSGTHVTITGSASGCPNPSYEFWMRAASQSTWQLVQGYGPGTTYDWNSTGAAAGTTYFSVWARDASSPAAYDAYASTPVSVTTPSCASVTESAAPIAVAHGSGTHVTITGAATGCTNSPLYEFWMRPAGSSRWQLVQGYGTSANYDWNSTGALAGTVYFSVWARDAGSPASYDAFASTPVTVS